MEKRKGFTLVELLAVIVLIALLALVVVPTVMNIITGDNKDKLDSTTEKLIFSAVDNFLDYNQTYYAKVDGASYCISIEELINKGFLEKNLKDIKTNNTMEELADSGYGIKSDYDKKFLKNKFVHEILSKDNFDDCINYKSVSIGELIYYKCIDNDNNNECDADSVKESNKITKIYANSGIVIVVPISSIDRVDSKEDFVLKLRKGANYISGVLLDFKAQDVIDGRVIIQIPEGLSGGEYVVELINRSNKVTANITVEY